MKAVSPRVTYSSLDAWRGVASIIVMLYHLAGVNEYHEPLRKELPLYKFLSFGWLGVQIFFVISGFCIINAAVSSLNKDSNVIKFLVARVRRVFPAYLCAMVVFIALILVTDWMVSRHLLPTNGFVGGGLISLGIGPILANLTLTTMMLRQPLLLAVSWTLCYEFAFYLIVALTMALVGFRYGARAMIRALYVITALCLLIQVIFGAVLPYPLDMWPEFGFGIVVYDVLSSPKNKETRISAVIVLVLSLLVFLHANFMIGMMQPIYLSNSVAMGFAVLMIYLHRYDDKISKMRLLSGLSFIGVFSYSLYLTHTFTLRVIVQILDRLHLPDHAGYIGLLIGSLGTVGLAYVFYLLCEKPFIRARQK